MKGFIAIAMVAVLFGGAYWWEHWRWAECKKVGHGTFYCIVNIGK